MENQYMWPTNQRDKAINGHEAQGQLYLPVRVHAIHTFSFICSVTITSTTIPTNVYSAFMYFVPGTILNDTSLLVYYISAITT